MSLRDEPGENVEKFTAKMVDKISRLEGANRLPADIGQIMCKALMAFSVQTFALQFSQMFNDFELHPKKYDYTEVV